MLMASEMNKKESTMILDIRCTVHIRIFVKQATELWDVKRPRLIQFFENITLIPITFVLGRC